MCPFTSLPAGEGPNHFSPATVKDWQPRRKSVSNACERCRRRKIRCDGNTPCSTCKRFSLQCIRSQKPKEVVASEHQAALEGRIHQLEAQLAAHVSAPMHGMETIDENVYMTTTPGPLTLSAFDWGQSPPPLTAETNFASPFSQEGEIDLGSFSAGTVGSIPSIAITECEPAPTVQLPTSSPVPSSWSGTTRASSPEMPPTNIPNYYPNMIFPANSKPFSPSQGSPHTAPSWEFMAQGYHGQLKPELSHSANVSRRTSTTASSNSMESDEANADVDADVMPLASVPHLPRQGVFAAHTESPPPGSSRSSYTDRSRAVTTTPFPSRFEAETLTAEFVSYMESLEHKVYSVTPALFSRICESVYPDPKKRGVSVDPTVSTQMARFHVFMAMAIAMKMRIKDAVEQTNSLLDTCYDLAMQQTTVPTFWQENGGIEASQLLSIFASIRREPQFSPRPLQPSFSW
ncbi:hypothetical protein CC80DRAFT_77011 [Byssothecium circinans]|uniref:Zn(2)-C6 fungal-type domain-containing protein n=1 Tax=Byssothecium circinans TaxID=147558 RepID=A0A6A5TTP8_9PLEO|nr:hypothetical protein CC80DRAFT_77011 [Byssothecium circinans]